MPDLNDIMDRMSALTVIEAAELAKMLEEKWGVSASAAVVQQTTTAPTETAPAQEEFEVILAKIAEGKKVTVVKELRTIIPGLDLKAAMAMANEVPKSIKEGATRDEADKIKEAIEKAGGTVEIR